jgi:hypothetical protein
MNKKISFPIAIIIIVVLAVLIGGLIFWQLKMEEEASTPLQYSTEPVECEKIEDLIERTVCYADIATERNDVAVCDLSPHKGVRYQCYGIFAAKINDSKICDQIPADSEEHQMLKDLCYSDIAQLKGDVSLCEKMSVVGKDGCYYEVARVTQNKEICNKINDPALKNGCFDLIFGESKMTQSQVLSIASDLAQKEGYDLEEYLEPEIEYDPSSEKEWFLTYHMKPPEPPGGCFTVFIDDDNAEETKLIPCE